MTTPDRENLLADFDIVLGKLESLRQCFAGMGEPDVSINIEIHEAQLCVAHARYLLDNQKEP